MWLTLLIITILTSGSSGNKNDERSRSASFSQDISDLDFLFKTLRNEVQQRHIHKKISTKDVMASSITGDIQSDRQLEQTVSTERNIRLFVHWLNDIKDFLKNEQNKRWKNRPGKTNLPDTNFREEKGWGNPGDGVPGG